MSMFSEFPESFGSSGGGTTLLSKFEVIVCAGRKSFYIASKVHAIPGKHQCSVMG